MSQMAVDETFFPMVPIRKTVNTERQYTITTIALKLTVPHGLGLPDVTLERVVPADRVVTCAHQ